MTTHDKVQAINDSLENLGYNDDMIFPLDEDGVNALFPNPWDALRSAHFGDINFTHDYFRFNGYGNIETLSDWQIDELYNEIPDEEED